MECTICSTAFPSHGQPTCASCARALVYQARLDRLADLLASESLRDRVNHVIAPPADTVSPSLPSGPELVEITESAKKHAHIRVLRDTKAVEARCSVIDEQLHLLKQQIRDATKENAVRRLAIKQRRTEILREKAELASRVPQLLEPLQATIRRTRRKLEKVHARTIEGRTKLCQETARLAGLQQRRRRMPDGSIVQDYTIGTITIFDLPDLNSAQPHLVNASLANVCRLLTTCCHYLSVRLPAQITPSHANYPHPTIFSLQSSYQGFQVPFPGSSSSTPSGSRILDQRSLPKPRLLHLDRSLIALAKEDPARYNLFIEGVSLLAWNIAWLCTSQGLDVPSAYHSVYPMGKNLYALFREHTSRSPVTQLVRPALAVAENADPQFGQFSHASIHRNLASAQSIDLMRNWRTASFTRFLDKIKQTLIQDMSGAEWEVISGDDFDNEREDEQAVLVGGARLSRQANYIVGSTVQQVFEPSNSTVDDSKKGYLKLKSRSGEGGQVARGP